MSKRRTRKEKERAKHTFSLSWSPSSKSFVSEPKKTLPEANVKRQFGTTLKLANSKSSEPDLADITAKDIALSQTKHDIIRSLILAGIIIGLELVLYLAWNV